MIEGLGWACESENGIQLSSGAISELLALAKCLPDSIWSKSFTLNRPGLTQRASS